MSSYSGYYKDVGNDAWCKVENGVATFFISTSIGFGRWKRVATEADMEGMVPCEPQEYLEGIRKVCVQAKEIIAAYERAYGIIQ